MSIPAVEPSQAPTTMSWKEVRFLADRGVSLCRQGEWKKGFEVLAAVAETEHREAELPGAFYSYLGYGVARYQRKLALGLTLARRATELRFFEPENFLNLARVHLLAGNRRKAYLNIVKGLRLDPSHQELRQALARMGRRKKPVIAFLPRNNPLNLAVGKARHVLGSSSVRRNGVGTETES